MADIALSTLKMRTPMVGESIYLNGNAGLVEYLGMTFLRCDYSIDREDVPTFPFYNDPMAYSFAKKSVFSATPTNMGGGACAAATDGAGRWIFYTLESFYAGSGTSYVVSFDDLATPSSGGSSIDYACGHTVWRGSSFYSATSSGDTGHARYIVNGNTVSSAGSIPAGYSSAIGSNGGGTLVIGASDGSMKRTTNGTSWSNVRTGAGAPAITSVTGSPSGVWLAALQGSRNILRSTDDGVTWTELTDVIPSGFTGGFSSVGPRIATDGSGVWVLVGQNSTTSTPVALRSVDSGSTWQVGSSLGTNNNLIQIMSDAENCFSISFVGVDGAYISSDKGISFAPPSFPTTTAYVDWKRNKRLVGVDTPSTSVNIVTGAPKLAGNGVAGMYMRIK